MNSDKSQKVEEDIKLWAVFYRTAYAIKRNRERELVKHGITWIQSSVLLCIKQAAVPPTPTDIARTLFRQPHTISELVKRMEKQSLVKRVRDIKSKNIIRVLLTDKGEEVLEEAHRTQVIHEIFSVLSKEKQKQLLQSMISLYNKAIETLHMSYFDKLQIHDEAIE